MELKRRTSFSFLILLAGFCLVDRAEAATYHVNAASGNDSASGGSAQPWKTFRKAAETAVAGDTILFSNGVYDSGWYFSGGSIKNSGSGAGAFIRFQAAAGQTSVRFSRGSFIGIKGLQYIEIAGFIFEGPVTQWLPTPMSESVSSMYVDDASVGRIPANDPARATKINQKFATYMRLSNEVENGNGSWGSYSAGINILQSDGGTPPRHIILRDNKISRYWAGINASHNGDDITIERNEISQCKHGIYVGRNAGINNSLIQENTVQQNLSAGIKLYHSNNVTVQKNIARFNGIEHISFQDDSANNRILDNDVRYGGHYCETMGAPGGSAINVHTAAGQNRIERNLAAYHFDLSGNDGNGIIMDLPRSGATHIVQNNILYRNMGSGISTTESGGNTIVNNTLVENGYQNTWNANGAGIRLARVNDTNNVIVNNLFYRNAKSCFLSSPGFNAQAAVNHNLYFPASGTPFIDGPSDYSNLTDIRNNTPWEDNGVSGDPLLANVGALDFQLTQNSPAVGAADPARTPAQDFKNVSRAAPADIGAHDYSGPMGPKTYFVAPTGSDANAGTQAAPFKTMQKAVNTAAAGEVVIVRAGTYKEYVNFNRSGTATAPITYQAADGERVIFDGSNTAPVAIGGGGLFMVSGNYLVFKGFEITKSYYDGIQQWGPGGCTVSNDVFDGIKAYNNNMTGIHLCGSDNTVTNSLAHDNFGLTPGNADGISVSDGARNTFRNNVAHDNGDDGIDVFKAVNNLVENNRSYNNGRGGDGNGFKLGHGGGNTVRFNISYNNPARGFDNNAASNNVLYNNTAYNNGWVDFMNNDNVGGLPMTLRNNISVGNRVGLAGPVTAQNNSWNLGIADCKFISMDPASPDFLKLRADSPCIDRGVNVGQPFNGTAPDLGAFETSGGTPDVTPPAAPRNLRAK